MSEVLHEWIAAAFGFIQGLGAWGILIGLMLEFIPSEIVLAYGGYLVQQGEVTLFIAILLGTAGCMAQQVILYWIGQYGGRPVVEKYGKYLGVKKRFLDIADDLFVKYGPIMVFTARFIPIVRQAISIPAGLTQMPMWRFLFYTLLGTIPWAVIFVHLGRALGENWRHIDQYAGRYTEPLLIGAAAVFIGFLLYKIVMKSRGKPAA